MVPAVYLYSGQNPHYILVADISVPGTGIAHRIYMYQVQK